MKERKVRLTGTAVREIKKNKTETCLKYDVIVDGSERKSAIRVEAGKLKFKKGLFWR